LFVLAAAAAAGFEAAASVGAGFTRAEDSEPGERLSRVLGLLTGLCLLALWSAPLVVGPREASWPTLAAGLCLMAGGGALRVAAIRRLGGRFLSDSAVAGRQPVETGGVYRRLAHPSELGLLMLACGGVLLSGRAAAWLGVALLYLLSLFRLALEERALTRRHGERYRLFRRATWHPAPAFTFRSGETGK
jgi:protein-S-isoprenylcysteine O-methyltransferase Ste14